MRQPDGFRTGALYRALRVLAVWLPALALATAAGGIARADERILDYRSDIRVHQDGSLAVTETITVRAEGHQIKRGIYRDFPVAYTTRLFIPIKLPFQVRSVTRDGKPEPFHTEKRSNGIRVLIGREDHFLAPGTYTYALTYTTNFQLGYFEDHDELYWNVTGNGWDFPIDRATASVLLPPGVPREKITHEGYTGPQGSKAADLTSTVNAASGNVEFATTKGLGPREGLTIVVGFPKGYVHEPTAAEKREIYLQADRTLGAVLAGLALVLAYYFVAWIAVGRDPPGGPIYPLFEPPLDLSPAAMRFLRRMAYDKKCFTAALIDMAVKGHAAIEEENGEFTLRRAKANEVQPLSSGEKQVAATLLGAGSMTLKQSHHRKIRKAIEKLGASLSKEYDGKLFRRNRWWLVPGWFLSAASLAAVAFSLGGEALAIIGFFSIWLSGWTLGCIMLTKQMFAAWRSALALRKGTMRRIGSFGGALFITAFATPFLIAEVAATGVLVSQTSIWLGVLLAGLVLINWGFWHWMKRPTVEGQRIRDLIEGFRMYLATAEAELLQRLHRPELTPALFEKYLPYALALDVENAWSEKFSRVLERAAAEDPKATGYHPSWYHGSSAWSTASLGNFAGGLGSSLGNAVSSSSTAPGGSSGGGGGGFSGGGGGGGGGGGW